MRQAHEDAAATLSGEADRADIPQRYTWNLAEIYASADAWRAAKDKIAADIPGLRAFEGRLGSSPAVLAEALNALNAVDQTLMRALVYASMLADEDTRDSTHDGMRQQVVQLSATFRAAIAYVEPEILRFDEGTVEGFLAVEPRLGIYRFYLEDIARRAPHTLSPAEEELLAAAAPLASAPGSIFSILSNADFPYPTVTLSDGKAIVVTPANYTAHRASPIRQNRQTVMAAYLGALGGFRRTFGTTMNGNLQQSRFFANARHYPSSLAAALDGPNIPVAVYTRLIESVNRNLPAFHRYLGIRKRMLGVPELHYYDLYASLVESVAERYTPEEAGAHIAVSMAALGDEYVATIHRAMRDRWIDVFPSPGKRSGAYSEGGAYDVHPYILMNYQGRYEDMSTLTHELGHTMQSYLSNRAQPYVTSNYPTFVAEVASTFNESLLVDHMMKTMVDDEARLSLLGNYLENIKGTVFRQTQFAEFELAMHETAQAGHPITGDTLAAMYLEITKKYYGHALGVTVVDDYVAHEWSMIPHFYSEFYVFQYATSFTASEALAQKVKAGDRQAAVRYLTFLSAGGSKYPIDLLKDAGVDMTTDEPLDLTMREMHRVMDEVERLLARRPAPTR